MSDNTIPVLIGGSGLRRRGLWGECLAEFLGTFVLLALGDGVVALAVAGLPGSGRTSGPTTFFVSAGDWLLITWGWAFAVAFGVYVAGGVTGAHLNPAVTLAFAVRRRFAWAKVLPYMLAQLVGAFVGAALVLLVYGPAIHAFEAASPGPKVNGHTVASFSIFATFPAPYFDGGIWGPLLDQVVGTMFLLLLICAVVDLRNTAVRSNLGPLVIGLVVAAVGMSFGANAGYAINPARDLGPRLLAWLAGWGNLAVPGDGPWFSNYLWIPIVGPLIGGVLGVLVYDLFVGDVLHARASAVDDDLRSAETGHGSAARGTGTPVDPDESATEAPRGEVPRRPAEPAPSVAAVERRGAPDERKPRCPADKSEAPGIREEVLVSVTIRRVRVAIAALVVAAVGGRLVVRPTWRGGRTTDLECSCVLIPGGCRRCPAGAGRVGGDRTPAPRS